MGHLANPISFRLGSVTKHKAIFPNSLKKRDLALMQSNLVIFKFLEIFFKSYLRAKDRKITKENVNENFLVRNLPNPFIAKSFTFSHAQILRSNVLSIFCFFFDTILEQLRIKKNKYVKQPVAISFFKPKKNIRRRARTFLNFTFKSKIFLKPIRKPKKKKIKKYKNKKKK